MKGNVKMANILEWPCKARVQQCIKVRSIALAGPHDQKLLKLKKKYIAEAAHWIKDIVWSIHLLIGELKSLNSTRLAFLIYSLMIMSAF